MADKIGKYLGKHSAYWEPFCGSMAVLLSKPAATMETVNDLHGALVNLARVLADEDSAVALYRRLAGTLMHEDLFTEAAERMKDKSQADPIDLAYDFFLTSWMGRNGVSGTKSYNHGFCVRYTKNGGHAAKRFHSAVETIPEWHERLRHVTILNRDGLDLIDRIEDAPGVVIYCDPPYLIKGALYVHDFESGDHLRLAESLRRFKKTRVVVSYYADARLAELYPGWNCIDCATTKALVNAGMRDQAGNAAVAPEVLIINESKRLF